MARLNAPRVCHRCGATITACMGFACARDVVAHADGLTDTIRELCGRCALWMSLQPNARELLEELYGVWP